MGPSAAGDLDHFFAAAVTTCCSREYSTAKVNHVRR